MRRSRKSSCSIITLLLVFLAALVLRSAAVTLRIDEQPHRRLPVSETGTDTSSMWYYNQWCGRGDLEYLDDAYCNKIFPSSYPDRSWTCPVQGKRSLDELREMGYARDMPLADVDVDTETLAKFVDDDDINACIILTKRLPWMEGSEQSGTSLHNKYYCLADRSASDAVETWSSSKIFAIANAAGHLRKNETTCAADVYGIDGETSGKHGSTLLGDLATIICSYDTSAGYTSNSLSSYFHDLGWRDNIHALVTSNWLGLDGHTLGGNYGEATPSDLSYTILDNSKVKSCAADKDPWPDIYSNSLSALAAAEMARRLVLHDDVDTSLRFPGLTSKDVKQITMGAEESIFFPGQLWGGMSADTAIFVQSALNMTDIDSQSDGGWRILSKLGAGYSSSRSRGEIVTTAYACLPVHGEGLEFTISVRGSVPYDSSLKQVEVKVANAVKSIVESVYTGQLS
jgi:hypothetical protein